MLEELFTDLTVWHWLALGLILFGIEMMTGTFDLLMISIAAWITAVFAWLAPDSLANWQGQVLFFGAAAVARGLISILTSVFWESLDYRFGRSRGLKRDGGVDT